MSQLKERADTDVHLAGTESSPFSKTRELMSGLMETVPDLSDIRNQLIPLLAPTITLALSGCYINPDNGKPCVGTEEFCEGVFAESDGEQVQDPVLDNLCDSIRQHSNFPHNLIKTPPLYPNAQETEPWINNGTPVARMRWETTFPSGWKWDTNFASDRAQMRAVDGELWLFYELDTHLNSNFNDAYFQWVQTTDWVNQVDVYTEVSGDSYESLTPIVLSDASKIWYWRVLPSEVNNTVLKFHAPGNNNAVRGVQYHVPDPEFIYGNLFYHSSIGGPSRGNAQYTISNNLAFRANIGMCEWREEYGNLDGTGGVQDGGGEGGGPFPPDTTGTTGGWGTGGFEESGWLDGTTGTNG